MGARSKAPPPVPRRLSRLPIRELEGGLRIAEAHSWRARLLGLAALDRLPPGWGLEIPRCRSVHTFGMRFELDLIFLGRDREVVRVAAAVPRRRFVGARRARSVLEVGEGEAERFIAALDAEGPTGPADQRSR